MITITIPVLYPVNIYIGIVFVIVLYGIVKYLIPVS